jgi:hypothetical protein
MAFGAGILLPQRYSVTGGNGLPGDGSPTLILDFIGGNVPNGATLGLDFTGQTFTAFSADPSASGFANFWAWS